MQVLSIIITSLPLCGEDRMRLNKQNKTPVLFCIVFDFHYLCQIQIRYLKNLKTQKLKNLKLKNSKTQKQ